jgi:hypothetical protein
VFQGSGVSEEERMRFRRSGVSAALLIAGCGVPPDEFVPEYAQSYCEYLLECGDHAQLTFDGITSIDQCLATKGPEVDDEASSCDFKRSAAKDCLDLMTILTCPEDPADVDANLPPTCADVFTNCPAGAPGAE